MHFTLPIPELGWIGPSPLELLPCVPPSWSVTTLATINADTVEGSARHARVDRKSDELPAGDSNEKLETLHARSVFPRSKERGLIEAYRTHGKNGSNGNLSAFERTRPH